MNSWGNVPVAPPETIWRPSSRFEPWPAEKPARRWLVAGAGRSYGDVGLNPGGGIIDARGLDRFIGFDSERGILRAESGILLDDVLRLLVRNGWFLPVTPGTRFVTLGGALANDIHGKNHHRAGTFGEHVRAFELRRSDGSRLRCAPEENADWYAATMGGLGLTGFITWVEVQLKRIPGPWVTTRSLRFGSIEEFFALDSALAPKHECTVAWIDCLASSKHLGRGIYSVGDHADHGSRREISRARTYQVRSTLPFCPMTRTSLRLFNAAYYRWPRSQHLVPYESFFYPLDAIGHWNRLYGRRGFFQHQSVVPTREWSVLKDMLDTIARSGQGSFLAVVKTFGDRRSAGMLSFPLLGTTLALDFPHGGASTLSLLERLDCLVLEAGGRIYPAKDARMSASSFQRGLPRLDEFMRYVDPNFESAFWRRVMS